MFNFDGSHVNLLIAFLAGIATFFASCLLPLVPTYIAYLSGISHTQKDNKKEIFVNSLFFTLGFLMIFILLGFTATSLGLLLSRHRIVLQRIGGIFLTFVGLFMLGFFEYDFLYGDRHLNLNHSIIKRRKLKSLVFGIVFGFAWSPCIGPVLGVILFWASQAATMVKGMLLLLFYGLGIGVPFIIIGLFYEKLSDKIKKGEKAGKIINTIAAIIILITGVLLLLGKLEYLSLAVVNLLHIDRFSH